MAQYGHGKQDYYGQQQSNMPPPPPPLPGGTYGYSQQPPPPPNPAGPPPPVYAAQVGGEQASYYQQQQQQQQPYQSYQQPQQPPFGQSGEYEKFSPKPRLNDLWALILFIVHLVGFVVLAVVTIPKGLKSDKSVDNLVGGKDDSTDPLIQLIAMMAVAAVIGFVLSLVYLLAMQRFAGAMIKITFILSILLYFALGAFYAYLGAYVAAVIMLIFGALYAWMYFSWRSRMPFAIVLLETVCGVTRKYGGTIGVTTGGLVVQMAWGIVWLLTVIGASKVFSQDKTVCKQVNGNQVCKTESTWTGLTYVIMVFCLVSFYWTSQVVKNILHVTVCGVFGTFYFLEGTAQMPTSSVTLGSLKRALTSAIGSICFGSLIIALIQTLRAILRTLAESGDGLLAFVACLFACLLAYIESLVEYFNLYAFAQVAIYGKPFCQAGRDTWTLIKNRGVEAIINDSLVGNVLNIGMILIGIVTAGIGFAYLAIKDMDFVNRNTGYTVLACVACFIVGLAMMSIVASVIESGVVSTFVALAEDPMALARTKPALFERIRQTWPDVVVGVN